MEKFKSPKLLITDHYDEQIRQLDIYTEELLEKYNENDLLPKEIIKKHTKKEYVDLDSEDSDINDDTINKLEGFKDPYRSEYNYDQNNLLNLDITPGKTRVREYLELVRSKAIDELKKVEQHNLDNYELNKDLYKYDRKSLTDEKVEKMSENLFKDKFAFVVKIDESDKSLLKFHTILTDFYLDEKDLEFIKRHLHASNQSDKSSTYILDKKTLFLHFVREYIIGLAHSHEYGTEIISITKSLLFEINQVEIDYMAIKNVRLQSKWSIHFSFIKSLILDAPFSISPNQPPYEIRDLSGLKQLEYLQIVYMLLNANSFNGLDKLIKLELIHCYTSEKSLCFDSLSNLQILRIEMLFFPIDLKSLENLKVLMIKGIYKLEYISNVSESITYLQLNSLDSNYNNPEVFFSRVFLPNLIYLKMSCGLLPYIKEQWFRGMKLLKELILNGNCLESLDFCRFNCLSHLEKLDLSDSQIEKLDEGFFMKLKKLKSLNLSNNPILKLGSNKFLGLKNLETLFLDKINWEFIRIEKDAFNGLTNLKKLSLEENFLEYIDPEAFSHTPKLKVLSLNDNRLESIDPKVFSYTPKLTELNICNNEMRIEENIFANLKHLKKIELKDTDLEHINKDILEFLKKSNCELIIL